MKRCNLIIRMNCDVLFSKASIEIMYLHHLHCHCGYRQHLWSTTLVQYFWLSRVYKRRNSRGIIKMNYYFVGIQVVIFATYLALLRHNKMKLCAYCGAFHDPQTFPYHPVLYAFQQKNYNAWAAAGDCLFGGSLCRDSLCGAGAGSCNSLWCENSLWLCTISFVSFYCVNKCC